MPRPTLPDVRARLRDSLRRAVAASRREDPWGSYLDAVEPVLLARPRAHRFAAVPLTGAADARAEPLAVWSEEPGAAGAAVAGSTTRPAALLEGGLVSAADACRAEWIVLARSGDRLAPRALERLGQAVALAPDATVVTCDDDALDARGRRGAARFRPGPSPDRWLALDDSGVLLCVRRAALLEHGASPGGPGWRHALALRLAGADGSGHAHVPLLLCHRGTASEPALPASELQQLMAARGEGPARVEQLANGVRRVRRAFGGEPLVEAIVCFRDRPELLRRCARSVLQESTYERLRLQLVDNGSERPETAALLRELARDPRVRVARDERPFNFAALNNAAVARSDADVVVLLNNDTAVITPTWIEELLEEACRPQVGAVAPLLEFPDGTVQHAGAALGLHGYAGHPFAGLAPDAATPFGVASAGVRNWLAVTAACMMVERRKLLAAGCFDESFVVAGNDVDLCLRLTARGHRSLCVPHVRLLHDESRSRGGYIDPGDFERSERSYGEYRTIGDPFYNPSLTLARTDCSPRSDRPQVR